MHETISCPKLITKLNDIERWKSLYILMTDEVSKKKIRLYGKLLVKSSNIRIIFTIGRGYMIRKFT